MAAAGARGPFLRGAGRSGRARLAWEGELKPSPGEGGEGEASRKRDSRVLTWTPAGGGGEIPGGGGSLGQALGPGPWSLGLFLRPQGELGCGTGEPGAERTGEAGERER